METIEKLPKHLNTACNAIQKQIDKYTQETKKLGDRIDGLREIIEERQKEIEGLKGQIAKLKGAE